MIDEPVKFDASPKTATIKPGWRTSEFWLSAAALALTALFASGALTNTTALAIAGIAATALTALGYKVSRTLVKTAGALLIGFGLATQVSCATVGATVVAAGRAIVECVKQDARAEIAGVTASLGAEAATSAIDLGAIGWPDLEAAAWSHGKIIGGCALAEFVAAWSARHPAVQGLLAAPDPGREALARLSARWGGVEWRTGTVR